MVVNKNKITAVVATFNRKELLKMCLDALLSQSYPLDSVIVIDNASTDGTFDFLRGKRYLDGNKVNYIKMVKNTGPAGGFGKGLKYAYNKGYDFFWLMDDDAVPCQTALGVLVKSWKLLEKRGEKVGMIGGAVVYSMENHNLSWILRRKKEKEIYKNIQDLKKEITQVDHLPFTGTFIKRDTIEEVGYPDKDFFIWLDDVEFSYRTRKAGKKIFVIKKSIVRHPAGSTIECCFFGKKIFVKSSMQPPWKDYYDARNYVFLIRKHGLKIRRFLPPGGLTLIFSLLKRDQKAKRAIYYLRGFIDGLLNKKGKII